jgi:hypothetical protein
VLLILHGSDIKSVYGYQIDMNGKRVGLAPLAYFTEDSEKHIATLHKMAMKGLCGPDVCIADFAERDSVCEIVIRGMELPEYDSVEDKTFFTPPGLSFVLNIRIKIETSEADRQGKSSVVDEARE